MVTHTHTDIVPVRRQADPSPPALKPQELILVKGLVVLYHEIHGSSQLMCQDGQGLAFAVLVSEPIEISFPWLIAFQEKDSCFAEGPLEMGVADLLAACALHFAVGFFRAFDQAAVGDEILDRWESLDGFNLIEDD